MARILPFQGSNASSNLAAATIKPMKKNKKIACYWCQWRQDGLRWSDHKYHHPRVIIITHDPIYGEHRDGPSCTDRNHDCDCSDFQTPLQWIFGINKYKTEKK